MKHLALKTIDQLDPAEGLDILDFGCGTGLFGLEFKKYIKTLTGIDTSTGMLDVFNKKTEDYNNIKSLNLNLETSNFDEDFNLVVSSMTFHHLNEPINVLKKLKKSLRNNGVIAIVDFDKEDGTFHPDNEGMGVKHYGFSKDELNEWAKETELKFEHSIINSISKNGKEYGQFLAIFSN